MQNTYQKPAELVNKRVLVGGVGSFGVDIACEAASFAKEAHLSMQRGYYFIPKHIFWTTEVGSPTK
jgi:cation diffusion facilitator CzcD-associated flavoprotein CzcO